MRQIKNSVCVGVVRQEFVMVAYFGALSLKLTWRSHGISKLRSQGGLVVINRASHLCDPGSILASGRMWVEFQSISIWLRWFFSWYSGFPPSSKSTPGLFHQAVLLCSKVIHGSCSGAERLAGSTAPSARPRWAAPLVMSCDSVRCAMTQNKEIQSPTARKGD